ncbi:hypothetical protein KJ570_00790 [Patescibacteria group bacterium]|nr:hypothetical protein [Patescibacteria group bacterium]
MIKFNAPIVRRLLLLILVFLGIVMGYFVFINYVGVSFFINEEFSIGEVGVRVYSFQPIFLRMYEENNGLFIRALYVDGKYRPRVVDLWLSGEWEGLNLDPVKYIGDKELVLLRNVGDLGGKILPGMRFKVEYITGEVVDGKEVDPNNNVCLNTSRICQVYYLVKRNLVEYKSFASTGVMSDNLRLPVLYLSKNIER